VSAGSRPVVLAVALVALAVVGGWLGVGVGSTGWAWPGAAAADAVAAQIAWDIRLPRTAVAWLAGALLGLAGAVAQGLFRNPLADPFLLGSASGAALGVALALVGAGGASMALDGWSRLGLTGAAFAGALAGVGLTLALARGVQHTLRLLLAGVIVGVVLGAARELVTLADPAVLQAMQGFMLGSTALSGWPAVVVMAAALGLSGLTALGLGRVLDGLALGEATARSLGLPLGAARLALVGALALATGAAVAQTGLIAFVGLAAPHLVRAIAPARHASLVLLSALMGGALLLAADLAARALIAPQELPVGVLTALLGGGYLLWLMHRRGVLGGGS